MDHPELYAEIDYNDVDALGLTMAARSDFVGGVPYLGETFWVGCAEDGTRAPARALGFFATPDGRDYYKVRVDWAAMGSVPEPHSDGKDADA